MSAYWEENIANKRASGGALAALVAAVEYACISQRAPLIVFGRETVKAMLQKNEVTLDDVGQAILDLNPLGDDWIFTRAIELWDYIGAPGRARELAAAALDGALDPDIRETATDLLRGAA